jgi:hypothetical protein
MLTCQFILGTMENILYGPPGDTLSHLARTLDLSTIVYPATETEAAWTVGYKLSASVAKHTAYHLGQIALMKRLV